MMAKELGTKKALETPGELARMIQQICRGPTLESRGRG